MIRLILCVSMLAAAANAAGRDWTKFPAVAQTDAPADVYVIGDVHSDYARLEKVLAAAGVIDGAAKWSARNSLVVFMGDLIDKGPRAVDVLRFVMELQRQAATNGGRVYSLLGNHEAEFLADPAKKKSREFAADLTAHGIKPGDVAACRGALGEFLCEEPFALRIRDWFFSHGGDTHGRTIAELSAALESGVDRDGFASRELIGADSILEARLGEKGEGGRPWVEEGATHNARELLGQYTRALGVRHIVQAHQHAEITFADGVHRARGQMFQRDGMLFLVDTGMSQGVGDSDGAVLWIQAQPKQAVAICADGSRTTIWDARTNPASGAAPVCGR